MTGEITMGSVVVVIGAVAEAVRWGKRGARINTISPGIIITPLANRWTAE